MAVSRRVLKRKELEKKLKGLSDWTVNAKETEIAKTFKTASFVGSLALSAKIAVHAEVMNHHPDLELSYGKLKVKLTTHDAKGITQADIDLAKRIDKMTVGV